MLDKNLMLDITKSVIQTVSRQGHSADGNGDGEPIDLSANVTLTSLVASQLLQPGSLIEAVFKVGTVHGRHLLLISLLEDLEGPTWTPRCNFHSVRLTEGLCSAEAAKFQFSMTQVPRSTFISSSTFSALPRPAPSGPRRRTRSCGHHSEGWQYPQ